MEDCKAVPASSFTVEDARRLRENQIQKLSSKIERRKAHIKNTIKVLKQHKANIASHLEKRHMELLERKNDVDVVISDYKNECHKLAEEDSKDLQEFYVWAKQEIVKCTESALERAPIEDNREIRKALEGILKICL